MPDRKELKKIRDLLRHISRLFFPLHGTFVICPFLKQVNK